MKHFAFLSLATFICVGVGVFAPIWPLVWYYALAVLRPQHLWEWSLPVEVRWSLIAAMVTLGAVLVNASHCLRRVRGSLVIALLFAMGVLVLASGTLSSQPDLSVAWMFEYGKVLMMAMVACVVIERFAHLRAMGVMMLIVTGYIAWGVNKDYLFNGYGMRLFLHGHGGYDGNGAALLIALGVPFAYSAVSLFRQPLHRGWMTATACVAAIFIIHAVMLSYSRTGMVALAAGLCWILWRHRPRRQVVVLAPAVTVVILALAGQEIRDEFLSTRDYETDPTAQSRIEAWGAAWNIALEYPLLGVGLRASNVYNTNFGVGVAGRTTHNQYLQTAADNGLPALGVFLALVVCSFHGASKGRRLAQDALDRADDDRDTSDLEHARQLCTAIEASIAIIAVGGMFLSLETFEPMWLIIVMGGIAPRLVEQRVADFEGSSDTQPDIPAEDDTHSAAAEPQPDAPPAAAGSEATPPLTYAERQRLAAA